MEGFKTTNDNQALIIVFYSVRGLIGFDELFNVCTRVYRENMFFKKRISATHNASACGLVRRDPKIFLISTMFRGSLGHLKFDHFYIVDLHSALAFLDRDLRSED